MNSKKPIKIIALGNYLYCDEGLGIHIVDSLYDMFFADDQIEVIEGSTDGIKLLGPVEDANRLLVVDAIAAGKEPGTVILLEDDDVPKYFSVKLSVHQLGFQEVLQAADLRGKLPEKVAIIGLQPEVLDFGTELSSIVEAQIPALLQQIESLIDRWKEECDESS